MLLASMTSLWSTISDMPIDAHKSVINASHSDVQIKVFRITYFVNLYLVIHSHLDSHISGEEYVIRQIGITWHWKYPNCKRLISQWCVNIQYKFLVLNIFVHHHLLKWVTFSFVLLLHFDIHAILHLFFFFFLFLFLYALWRESSHHSIQGNQEVRFK